MRRKEVRQGVRSNGGRVKTVRLRKSKQEDTD